MGQGGNVMTDQEIWKNYYMQGATVQREDDDEPDLSVAESVMLWAGASLVVLLLSRRISWRLELER